MSLIVFYICGVFKYEYSLIISLTCRELDENHLFDMI